MFDVANQLTMAKSRVVHVHPDIDRIGNILKAAACPPERQQSRQILLEKERLDKQLDTYSGDNAPGQLGNCDTRKKSEKPNDFTLEKKPIDILQPSTGQARRTEPTIASRQLLLLPAYLRLRQKHFNKTEWLVDAKTGQMHRGSHCPFSLTTKKSCRNSPTRTEKRRLITDTGKTAVAAGASWWMRASSSSKPAWLEKREATTLAKLGSFIEIMWAAGEPLVELALDKDHAAPNVKHWSPRHYCEDAEWRSWSDWHWSGPTGRIGKTPRVGGGN